MITSSFACISFVKYSNLLFFVLTTPSCSILYCFSCFIPQVIVPPPQISILTIHFPLIEPLIICDSRAQCFQKRCFLEKTLFLKHFFINLVLLLALKYLRRTYQNLIKKTIRNYYFTNDQKGMFTLTDTLGKC